MDFEDELAFLDRPFKIEVRGELAEQIRSQAIIEGLDPIEYTQRAYQFYAGHLSAIREGYDGPFYRTTIRPKGWLGKILPGKLDSFRLGLTDSSEE